MKRYLFVIFLFYCYIFFTSTQVHGKDYIPSNAFKHLPMVEEEQDSFLPNFIYRAYFASLIEQESCIGLEHSKCWDPTSRLKTSREEGAGLGQLTKAYRKDGTLRFDNVKILRNNHKEYLKDLSWGNIYHRPDLQIRSMLLLWRDNYRRLKNEVDNELQVVIFANAAYNGGLKGVRSDRRLCNMQANCNADIWFDNVEKTCSKSKKVLYGNKSACDINRVHTKNVFKVKYNKYGSYFLLTKNIQ